MKKLLIALLLSTFGSYANAQFSEELTAEELNMYKEQGDTTSVWEAQKNIFAQFQIKDKYKKEITSVIKYYEIKKQLLNIRNIESSIASKEEYGRTLCEILFLNGGYLSTSNYQLAYLLRNKLNLSEETLRRLANKAVEISRKNDIDSWPTEFKELSAILTNDQMDQLLRSKNAHLIWEKVHNNWNLICKSREYNTNEDSIIVCAKLYSYYSKFAIADELYANNPALKQDAYRGIKKFAPSIIYKIEALQRKQKKNSNQKQKNKPISINKDQYLWALHSNQPLEKDIQAKEAIMLALGARGRIERDTAFSKLLEYSNQENITAINALGLMYLNGYGIKADTIAAISCWEKAGANGCSDAYNNIGILYKTEVNYLNTEKAFLYFSKAAEKGNLIGSYFTGYMLYKGIGCMQSYEKAVVLFDQGANENYAPSLYMLGLCYRNGYGVDQNEEIGKTFLRQSASQLYKPALKELEQPYPENKLIVSRITNKATNYEPINYNNIKISNKRNKEIESGEYIGTLITYDWSGKHIIEETSISLIISSKKEQIICEWHEDGKEAITILGELKDNKLVFTNQEKRVNNRYKNMIIPFVFQEANIELARIGGDISLQGTVQMYSQTTEEEGNPMYLSVNKIDNKGNKQNILTYPNPFSQELNLRMTVTTSDKVLIYIYNIKGEPVYKYSTGTLPIGEQHLAIYPNLAKGNYIVKAFIGKEEYKAIIICK